MRGEVLDITDLGEEHSTGGITDTVNGSDNFHLLNCKGRTGSEDACYLIKLLHKMKERGDLPGQNELFSEANGSDRVFSSPDNLISADRDLSTLPIALKRICNNLSFRGSDKAGRGNSLRNRSMVAVKTLHTDSNSGKMLWRILLISFLVEAIR